MKMRVLTSCLVFLMTSSAMAVENEHHGQINLPQGPHRVLVIGGDCVECDFSDSNMAGARFIDGNFSRADFSDTVLIEAHFMDISIDGSDFTDALVNQARFTGTSLTNTLFNDAELLQSHLQRVDLSRSQMDSLKADQSVFVLSTLEDITAPGASFEAANFRSCNLRRAQLNEASFRAARISGSDLSGANLHDADFTGSLIVETRLVQADLTDADMTGVRFRNVDLTGADLRGVDGLNAQVLEYACGDETTQLPEDLNVQLGACPQNQQNTQWPLPNFVFVTDENVHLTDIHEMEAARAAMTIALQSLEDDLRLRENALAESHQRLIEVRTSLESRDNAESERDAVRERIERNIDPELRWKYTLRPSEIGEPIQILLQDMAQLEQNGIELGNQMEVNLMVEDGEHSSVFILQSPEGARFTISRELQCHLDEDNANEEICEDYIRRERN